MINFTFIIPHYNLEPYLLRRCLNSIPHREDVQIIIVDDHSPDLYDNNSNIIEEKKDSFEGYKDKCTEVIFLEKNLGPGVARNEALKNAKGKWILFADADDYYNSDCLQHLMDSCIHTSCDAVWFGYGDKDIYGKQAVEQIQTVEEINEIDKLQFLKVVAPWNKVVRKSLLEKNGIRFDDGYYCEDQFYSLRTVCECSKAGLFCSNVYNHLSNDGSLSKTENINKLCRGFEIEMRYNKYLKQKGYLSLSCRNVLIGGLLYRIYLLSPWKYRWYCIREFFSFGWDISWTDYKVSCIQRCIRPNLWYQISDPIRVKIGKIQNSFFSK